MNQFLSNRRASRADLCVLIQIAICVRGARLLRCGGRLVYSTCSLNPVENEAVVAEVLRQSALSSGECACARLFCS